MSETLQTKRPRVTRYFAPESNRLVGALQWYGRHCTSWTLFFIAVIGIPALYHYDRIGIDYVNLLGQYMAFAIVAVSLDLVWGYAGMLCLCQAFFFCLGGYAMGMYLAHHGGPEGIIDHNGWKLPACLYVVYPYKVGEAPADALVPWFWKPFWTLGVTIILGLVIPGVVAGVIGFFVFRSRVRGVFFAVLTQAITLAAWLIFTLNDIKCGGTNGLTRFDRVILGSHEKVQVQVDPQRLDKLHVAASEIGPAIERYAKTIHDATVTDTNLTYLVTVPRGQHPWGMKEGIESLVLAQNKGLPIRLSDVADVRLAGYLLTDPQVKLGLYVLTVLALGATYVLCRTVIKSRIGRVLVAIRDNESRLRFFGYEPYHFKVFVFALSGMLAGLGGMLYVPQKLIITPHNMQVLESIMVVIWVAVGGRCSLSGAILGTLVVKMMYYYFTSQREFLFFAKNVVPESVYQWFIWRPDYWQFVLGGMFVVVVLLLPDGLISVWHRLTRLTAKSKRMDEVGLETEIADETPDGTNGNGHGDTAAMQQLLQRVVSLKRERTISLQQRSLLDTELVRVENVKVLFDGFKALDVDEFSIDYYELQVVIGPNGAGKTTLCDVISGKTRATSGKVFFAKEEITRLPEVDIARRGVGRKFQTPSIFNGLTVYESMEMALPGRQSLLRNFQHTASAEDQDRIHGILKRVRLEGEANQRVQYLSHGQRQWLEISMLLLAGPHLLLVDEPAAGLTDEETALTAELLLELQSEHSVLVIEHDMDFVRLLGAPVTVLNEGKVMAQGTIDQVQADPRVVEAYLGRGGSRQPKG
jgi:urea transport system ATP-binding protein